MEASEKIKKAKIQMQASNPFFAYLSLYLKFREAKENELSSLGKICVDAEGNCVYQKEFIESLTENEVKAVIAHEILHLSLLHLTRLGKREILKWNIATDIVVNHILTENCFVLPEGCLKPKYNNSIEIFEQTIENINEKTPEQIYDELKDNHFLNSQPRHQIEEGFRFDFHKYSKDKKDEGNQEKINEIEKFWKEITTEAYISSKLAGKELKGIERIIVNLHKNEIDWKVILLREIQKTIPYDYTYEKPHKKSYSCGFYMPDVKKENIDIVVCIDVSGSITQHEYSIFLNEIINIYKTFRNRINLRILAHDIEVNNDYSITNSSIEKLKNLKIIGGGGTSHKPVLDYIQKNIKNNRLAIFLTDGYSDLQEINLNKYKFKKIFVITENGAESNIIDNKINKVIKLKNKNNN